MNLLVMLLVIAAFVVVLQASVAGAFRNDRPQLALVWAPYDAEARARLGAQLVTIPNSAEAQKAARALATDALRRQAILPAALRALAMAEDGTNETARARALGLIQQAQHLSRRDQMTQIWLIEHYIEQGDFARVMPHVDIALRTSWSSRETLFSLLATAFENDGFYTALLTRLRQKPDWAVPFLAYVAVKGEPNRTTRLSLQTLDVKVPAEREVVDALLQRLAASGEYDLAWTVYSHFGLAGKQAGSMRGLVDGGFDGLKAVPPFGWTLASDADLLASLEPDPDGSGNVLRLIVSSGHSGEVARQLVRLPAGSYRLRAEIGDVPQDIFERPELRISCAGGAHDRVLASAKPQASGSHTQIVERRFAVPSECQFQWLSIFVAGSETTGAEAPWIDNIELTSTAR